MRRPCSNCPWRRDAKVGYWDPTHFESIAVTCRDDGTQVMGCHKSTGKAKALPCQGWARVMGFEAIGVRIAVMTGRVTNDEVQDRGGPALYSSFDEMLRANGVVPPPRNRFR